VCDLGYYGHRQFARLTEAGVHVVTRLSSQASYAITAQRLVPVGRTPDGDEILMDATITLGSPNNRRGMVLAGLRLIVSRNRRGVVHHFVTDRFDLTATEVVRLYRQRWRIELFFRWLKRQLGAIRPLGTSREAVWLTVLLVAIVALLGVLVDAERPASVSRISWVRGCAQTLLLDFLADGYCDTIVSRHAPTSATAERVRHRGTRPDAPPRPRPGCAPRRATGRMAQSQRAGAGL
jgi:hypothetical protein